MNNIIPQLKEIDAKITSNSTYDNIKDMITATYYSEEYFVKAYKKYFGVTPKQKLTKLKVVKVKSEMHFWCNYKVVLLKNGYSDIEQFKNDSMLSNTRVNIFLFKNKRKLFLLTAVFVLLILFNASFCVERNIKIEIPKLFDTHSELNLERSCHDN